MNSSCKYVVIYVILHYLEIDFDPATIATSIDASDQCLSNQ